MNKKLYFLSRADMIVDVAQAKICRHVATYKNSMWHICVYVRVCVCMCMCAYVCVCDINENKQLFMIFAISLITHLLYTRSFPLIFLMWDYIFLFLCACDMAKHGACD